jgi:hypothetical protein
VLENIMTIQPPNKRQQETFTCPVLRLATHGHETRTNACHPTPSTEHSIMKHRQPGCGSPHYAQPRTVIFSAAWHTVRPRLPILKPRLPHPVEIPYPPTIITRDIFLPASCITLLLSRVFESPLQSRPEDLGNS